MCPEAMKAGLDNNADAIFDLRAFFASLIPSYVLSYSPTALQPRQPHEDPAMLTMLGSPRRMCDGWTRREALSAACGLALGGLAATPQATWATEPTRRGKAKSVILLFLLGGAATED